MTDCNEYLQVKMYKQRGSLGDLLRQSVASKMRVLISSLFFLLNFIFFWGGDAEAEGRCEGKRK